MPEIDDITFHPEVGVFMFCLESSIYIFLLPQEAPRLSAA